MAESEDKGYTVKDRRYMHLSEEEKARLREEEEFKKAAAAAGEAKGEVPLPEITFSAFLLSVASSAFLHLGLMPEPGSGELKKELPLAKQTIDILGMLREKTRGNLTSDEENLFDHLLYDLRMQYIKEAG
jgi:hypothetical protein